MLVQWEPKPSSLPLLRFVGPFVLVPQDVVRCGKDATGTLREDRLHEDSRVRPRAAVVPKATPGVALVACLRRDAGESLGQVHVAVELDGAHPLIAISCVEHPRLFVFSITRGGASPPESWSWGIFFFEALIQKPMLRWRLRPLAQE